ncbi:50S ribosomal protein L31 [Patescibacteria group bacterium]|nr:50S ribosomal protein L31 [Patescibacteria group bacterium]MBU4023244.1 50S ribosomal protein L31 [Patescibacteria group bacterium]MBU4078517.1 50S ribosomal protein L31 [Patescibacteria group bacterium]
MAKDIHPQYYPKTKISCSCGNKFEVGSTKENMEVEVCSACHSFYTGKEKMIDAMGQVQKFQKRLSRKQDLKKK